MAPKKLTEADKKAILGLYRQPQETTSTLAERYGVSNSTISRLLKASLPEAEYSALIQQKRSAADRGHSAPSLGMPVASVVEEPVILHKPRKAPVTEECEPVAEPVAADAPPKPLPPSKSSKSPEAKPLPGRRTRSRPQTNSAEAEIIQRSLPTNEPLDLPDGELLASQPVADPFDADSLNAELAEPWDDDLPLSDDYDEEEEDDDEDDEAWDSEAVNLAPQLEALEIYPLTAQALPALCYLVVERVSSELVALPLRTFASLGQIPEEEEDSRTLPVFDNHRVARRFSRRNQRVIKVPDGALLQTTSPYLQAKGITRLLIDGQVFALEDSAEERAEVPT